MTEKKINHCLVCKSDEQTSTISIKDHLLTKESFELVTCAQCGFKYLSNPPTSDLAYKYYETEEYIEHSDSSKGLVNTLYHWARSLMFKYKYRFISHMDLPKKILDFGTGTGYFLNYMYRKGYDVTGVEISEKARSFGKEKFNLTIHPPENLFTVDFPRDFGVITFWHVLEHVYNPEEVLLRVKELLSKNGRILIAVPNHQSLDANHYGPYWAAYDVPRHLWHWDPETMKKFAHNLGLEVEKMKILPLDPFYNTIVSASYRKKKWGFILIPFIGAASLVKGWINTDKASSVIYFLKKA